MSGLVISFAGYKLLDKKQTSDQELLTVGVSSLLEQKRMNVNENSDRNIYG